MREAIELTVHAVEQRARLYRNLVVAVSVMIVATPVAAVVLRSWLPLTCFAFVPMAVVGHLALDSRIVKRWRRDVEGACRAANVPLDELSRAITSVRVLPAVTLRGMLDTLTSAHPASTGKRDAAALERGTVRSPRGPRDNRAHGPSSRRTPQRSAE